MSFRGFSDVLQMIALGSQNEAEIAPWNSQDRLAPMIQTRRGARHWLLTNVPLRAAAAQDMRSLSSRMICELGCWNSDSVPIVRAFMESSKLRVYIQISRIGRIKRAREARAKILANI